MASLYGIENSLAAHLLDEENGHGEKDGGSSRSSLHIGNSTPFDSGEALHEADLESRVSTVLASEQENDFGSYNLALLDEKFSSPSQSVHTTSTGSRGSIVISGNHDSGSFGTQSNASSYLRDSRSSLRRVKPAQVNVVLNADNGEVSELDEELIKKLHRTSSKNSLHSLTKSNVENLKSAASVMQSKRMGYGLGPINSKSAQLSHSLAASRCAAKSLLTLHHQGRLTCLCVFVLWN